MVKAEKRSGSYSVRVSLTDPATGERTQKRVTARTKRELDVKVSDVKARWRSGTYFDRGDGRPVSPRTVEHVMQKAVERLELPRGTPHTLRHSHATLLLTDGVPPHVVQARLGHASSRTTLDIYAHVLPVSEHDVAGRFAAVLHAGSDQIVTGPAGKGTKPVSA